jgi:subfamily B ATP-binding cassette protein MsbA
MQENTKQHRPRASGNDVRTFIRVVRFAKPYWFRLLIGAICSIVGGGSIIAMFLTAQHLLGFILDSRAAMEGGAAAVAAESPASTPSPAVEAPEPVQPPVADALEKQLLRKFVSPADLARLESAGIGRVLVVCGVLLVVILVNSLAVFASIYYLQWVGQRVVMDLRIRFFAHLQRLSVAFYHSSRTGDMISRTVADTQMLQHTVSNVMTDLVRQPVVLLMVLAYILVTEWRLAIFSVVLIPTCALPILLLGRRVRRISREGQRRLADLTSVMQEALAGVVVVKAFGQEAREERRFSDQCRGFFRRMISATKAKALNDPIAHVLGGFGGVGVLLYALVTQKPLEDCVVFACAVWALYEPIKKLGRISMEIQQSSAAADRIFEVLDTPVTVTNRPGAQPLAEPLRDLVFDHVQFHYDGDSPRDVFTDLTLRVPAGQSLAIVGPSGCGKTTLVALLLRFFDATGGSIRFNDTDIRDCTVESLRAHIGLVMQDTFLFADSVAANIAYGRPEATREEVEDAARRANAHDFIQSLPQGYDTVLGERGTGLSGGQRQRLAIARAILRQPPILVLDEATSALDSQSERVVQADIDRLMGRYTVIVIAHRLSTIAKCDRIAVLGRGGVLEYGTHAELHASRGLYRELHDLQFASREALSMQQAKV